MKTFVAIGFFCALVWSLSEVSGDDATKPQPPTHKVVKAPLKTDLNLEGIFEPRQSTEIVLRPETWTELTVREAIEPGTAVKPGDRLLSLDTAKLDEAIRDAETTVRTEGLELQELALELRVLEQTTPHELAQAKRDKDIAVADHKYFTETERSLETRLLDFMLKSYGNSLQYAQEELRQLEKMYKADDLMEETEEIIVKQQRDQVEQIAFMLDVGRLHRDRTVQADLPRHEQSLENTAERARIANEKAELTLPLALNKLRLRIAKQTEDQRRNEEKLFKLKHDRELMELKSLVAGVVFYGPCRDGNWTHSDVATKLRRGGNLSAHEVLMTVVPLRPLVLRTTIHEKDLAQVKPGMAARVSPAAWSNLKLKGVVERVATLPDPAGKFIVLVKLDEAAALPEILAPGMSGSAKVITRNQPDALTVPAKAVFESDEDDDRHYVYVTKDGKPSQRNVTLGYRSDEQIEITSGLAEGDTILLEKPAE
jgi:multidrug efflux pump subunit AcrA (membrane-fusion protein)